MTVTQGDSGAQRDSVPREEPLRVVLVDDHAVVRRGLTDLLASTPDIEVVGTASDGAEAQQVVARTRPHVVLMDLQMPGTDGVAATRAIVASQSDAQVLVLTSFSDSERILAALDAGAVGYLLKDADPDDVIEGVRAVVRGESPLHPKAARELLLARNRSAERPAQLTPREADVLRLVRVGLANKQIGRRLGISERTVKAHLTSAFQRIGVQDRTQAALWAERHGL
jgi:DNA-binding NarL/FixJ family response regulator